MTIDNVISSLSAKADLAVSGNTPDKERILWAIFMVGWAIFYGLYFVSKAIEKIANKNR